MSTTTRSPAAQPDLVTDLATSLFLSLFVTPVGSARPAISAAELHEAVRRTGPRGIRAAGHGSIDVIRTWQQAGLVAPMLEATAAITLLPRGVALLTGPFRWERLTRALRRQQNLR